MFFLFFLLIVQAINQPAQTMYTPVAASGQYVTPVKTNQTQEPNAVSEPVKSADGSLHA